MSVFGFRRKPGSVARAVFGLMPIAYRLHLGRLFGHTFLLMWNRGRKSGKLYATALKTMSYDRKSGEVVICSVYGMDAAWMKNIAASPATRIQIAGTSYVPTQRILTEDEAFASTLRFRREHGRQLRLFSTVLGWGKLNDEASIREFVHTRPFVAFAPPRA
jgi:deazaflavin-dependent oxidoreductase (nitroreductase family)